MNKLVVKVAALTLLAASFSMALAQERGQGGGRGGRGMRQMGMNMGGSGSLMMLQRKDVQADIKLSAEQIKSVEELRAKNEEEMSAMRENMRASGGDFESMRRDMEKRGEETQKKVDAILDDGQRTRLKQIGVQMRGNMALMDPVLQKDLGFSSEQTAKIEELQGKQREAMMAIMEKRRNGDLDQDQMQDLMRKNMDILGGELLKLLTPDQTTKFKDMQGAPFKATEPMPMMGMGRRGGGGG